MNTANPPQGHWCNHEAAWNEDDQAWICTYCENWVAETNQGVLDAIRSVVMYNWHDEEDDYNHEALEPGNSRENHIFNDLMLVQRWLETQGYPHVEPRIVPEGEEDE